MPMQRSEVVDLIVQKIRDVNPPTLAAGGIELGAETRLFGNKGVFDSIGLVSLIVEVEQGLADACGVNITLADERAMSQKHSPFRTVDTLAQYAVQLLADDASGK
jgi:D-alanine--poly(phosphoribitol) ligase subunit 2